MPSEDAASESLLLLCLQQMLAHIYVEAWRLGFCIQILLTAVAQDYVGTTSSS